VSSLYRQTTGQIFEIVKTKSKIRQMHSFSRLLRESFILQDALQGIHWANNQAILHPFTVHNKNQHMKTLPSCVISDCLDQNTSSLYADQRTLVQYLHTKFPVLKKVTYFSDGSVVQYKNRRNISTFAINKILVCLLNGTSLQQAMRRARR
jgi:hypothetical protein